MIRVILIPAFLIAVAVLVFAATSRRQPVNCLPDGIKSEDVVSAPLGLPGKRRMGMKTVTVGDKLKQLGARCRRGKLVDAQGKEIRFYHLQGCWGNPPPDYLEILARQRRELETLKKRYTVIEMTCNPSGEMPV